MQKLRNLPIFLKTEWINLSHSFMRYAHLDYFHCMIDHCCRFFNIKIISKQH